MLHAAAGKRLNHMESSTKNCEFESQANAHYSVAFDRHAGAVIGDGKQSISDL